MASSPQAAQLLEEHRQQQARLSALTVRTAIAAWPTLERDQARWLALLLALVRRDRATSAELARRYMTAYRVVERAPGRFDFGELAPMNEEQVITSLMVTGPVGLQKRRDPDTGFVPREAERKVMTSNAGAVSRHVLNGGREVVDDIVQRDPAVQAYMRLTDGNPCYWCAMLASRGPVFKSQSFESSDARFSGPGNQKVHDSCGCSLVPIYGSGEVALTSWKKYDRLWQSSTQGKSGREAIKAFRQAYSALG